MIEDITIFKSRRINKRLLILKKEFDKSVKVEIDYVNKNITIFDCLSYSNCLILEKFYQDYSVSVKGDVYLMKKNLKQLPKILFKEVNGFYCQGNYLTSLKNCPEKVIQSFKCTGNLLSSLEYCPEEVGGCFTCSNNLSSFTKEDVEKYCKVKRSIYWIM
jgi:hypothetical protein